MAEFHPLKLRLREIAFILLGVATSAGLSVLWFGMIPELLHRKEIARESLSGLAAVVTVPGLQVTVLLAAILLLAAGSATRMTTGSDRATLLLAGGCLLAFGALALTVNVLFEPLLAAP